MNDKRPATPPPPVITPGDLYYILFRHKWMIGIISAIGIIAALIYFKFWPVQYRSEAELFIQSVRDSKTPSIVGVNESRVKDDEGNSIINTELAILTSLDVAREVVSNYVGGAAKIMEKVDNRRTSEWDATYEVLQGLRTDPIKKSSVVRVTYQHPDGKVAQDVLEEVIRIYKKRHTEIHAGQSVFTELFRKQIDDLKNKLRETETELAQVKTNSVFISVADSKKETSEQIARVKQAIWDAKADLAEHEATKAQLEGNLSQFRSVRSVGTNQPSGTNSLDSAKQTIVSTATKSEYRRLRSRLEKAYEKETGLLTIYTPENKLVKIVQEQIEKDEERKQQLEEENPGLIAVKLAETSGGGMVTSDPSLTLRMNIGAEQVKIIGISTRIATLTDQLAGLQEVAKDLTGRENTIAEKERNRRLLEQQVTYFEQNMEQAKIDTELALKVFNISVVQAASPGAPDRTKMKKTSLMIAVGSIGLALALTFLVEFFLDPTLKRPLDIENKLGLPLFLSIPQLSLNGNGKHLNGSKTAGLLGQGSAKQAEPGKAGVPALRTEIPPWDPHHQLRPFVEALRDRLITYFEIKNLTHKPKLVAVTSCGEGAGVSTVAAGLAASLSETGDGNVLLVDMNQEHGATHQFYKGDLTCALDDALELEKRETAMVADNLYVVSEMSRNDKLPSALPKRFKNLVPRLRASDYDYIIFDMPPVTQISITPRLARFMDSVLMVVEAEQNDRDVVKRATDVLVEAEANVGVVMNKLRTYVPKRLAQDL